VRDQVSQLYKTGGKDRVIMFYKSVKLFESWNDRQECDNAWKVRLQS